MKPVTLKNKIVIVAAKNDRHNFSTVKDLALTSMAKSTPPIGAPNVAVTPTATATVMKRCLSVY